MNEKLTKVKPSLNIVKVQKTLQLIFLHSRFDGDNGLLTVSMCTVARFYVIKFEIVLQSPNFTHSTNF
mgnify:CR=1 FL=1